MGIQVHECIQWWQSHNNLRVFLVHRRCRFQGFKSMGSDGEFIVVDDVNQTLLNNLPPPTFQPSNPKWSCWEGWDTNGLWNKYRTDSPRLVKINNLNSWNFQWELSCEYCDIDISCPHLNLSTWFLSNNDIEHHPFTIGYFKHRYTQQTLVGNTGVCISSLTKQLSKPSGFCPISGLGGFGILQ